MNKNKFERCLTFDDIAIRDDYSDITSRSVIDLETQLTKNYTLPTPFISSPMDSVTGFDMAKRLMELGGLGIVHRFMRIEEAIMICKNLKNDVIGKHSHVAFAIGSKDDYLERAQELVKNGCNIILIDVAKGYHVMVKNAIENLRSKVSGTFDIIAGNVATEEGAKALYEWGADGIRVGIGCGSVCETRIRTGVGTPQASAIYNTASSIEKYNVPIIADGGIRVPADCAKAIALGASTIMIGSIFSGTKEAPGAIKRIGMWPDEELFKEYRGSASSASKSLRGEASDKNVEGNHVQIRYKGKVERLFRDLCDGLQSSLSYTGSRSISEFQSKAILEEVTSAAQMEAKPHALYKNL